MKELGADWKETERAEWTSTKQIATEMYLPLQLACTRQWPSAQLEQVGKAIQVTLQ